MITATVETIKTERVKLLVETKEEGGQIIVSIRMPFIDNCLLHWGLQRNIGSEWRIPPRSCRPDGSRAVGRSAVQTPFLRKNGEDSVVIKLDQNAGFSLIAFALYYTDSDRWDNNRGKNYHIEIPAIRRPDPNLILNEDIGDREVVFRQEYDLEPFGSLAAAVIKDKDRYNVVLISNMPGALIFHWGIAAKSPREWRLPPASLVPDGTAIVNDTSAETSFEKDGDVKRLALGFKEESAPLGVTFVLRLPESGDWLKFRGKNFFVPVSYREEKPSALSHIADEIIEGEMGDHSWTLMHRFNLCHDLIDEVSDDVEGMAMLCVWLRFSSIRQLDWQRRYNTKPRELSHAQDRLTLKLAAHYIEYPGLREYIRLMVASVGKGGEGQRIRDEILNIMHRYRIKEVAGHFMEEWHQKLHNNTTPDDVVICEAYLEFLKNDGDLDLFYDTLESGGVTRERLESFERPIVTDPDFVPHLKEGLVHDFEEYLRLLNSVHSGTDLESAINSARYLLNGHLKGHIEYILKHRVDRKAPIVNIVKRITEARSLVTHHLNTGKERAKVRDLLYLDLSLEEFVRTAIERTIHESMDNDQLVELIDMVLTNFRFFYDNDELAQCFREWRGLKNRTRFTQDWSLRAKASLDRIGRALGGFVDRYYGVLQPKAEHLGKAFNADAWTISLFTEEVVRGRPAFVLSMLIHHLDPVLRKKANLGDWQVISPGAAIGRVEVVDALRSVQGRRFDRSTVIIANKVRGDEEPPEGVTAVITPDAVDLVSHIAVRARNAHLLFATCYDAERYKRLDELKGHVMKFLVNTAGDVVFEEAEEEIVSEPVARGVEYIKRERPEFAAYAVSSKDFSSSLVGGKSCNLRALEGKLPEWIHLPGSVALPFGILEKVLSHDMNSEIAKRYNDLKNRIGETPKERLGELKNTILDLKAPEDLLTGLRSVMEDAGLEWPEKRDDVWMCIKRVWASKWNERAYLSRNARGIPHEELLMAVLIQQVVDAEYAFVIHTVNPFTEDRSELFAEVVPGLGETLVGNYPGRAFGFVSKKEMSGPKVLSYPNKSIGLYGSGLIFRSDSNAEDLPGYAGAGLYDSIMLESPRAVTLDYTGDPLVWNEEFRREFLATIVKIGSIIEETFGEPQDIEGVYSGGRYSVVQSRPQVGIRHD